MSHLPQHQHDFKSLIAKIRKRIFTVDNDTNENFDIETTFCVPSETSLYIMNFVDSLQYEL